MKKGILTSLRLLPFVMLSILPGTCSQGLLKELTPFVIDGSNDFMRDFIFSAAPFVLP
ncbi:MAG: hypothetical protein GY842_28515 [bacterium]|nr:hypothetical protein [bacterium]